MSIDRRIGINGLDTRGSSAAHRFGQPARCGENGMERLWRPSITGKAYLSRRRAKRVGLLLLFVSALVIASAVSLAPSAKEKASPLPFAPTKIISRQPPQPFNVWGFTTDGSGQPLVGCQITITNLRTSSSNSTTSYDPDGTGTYAYYEYNLNWMDGGWVDGDPIKVSAVSADGMMIGEAQGQPYLANFFLNVDVVLVLIPEFPMAIIPVAGMMALVVAVSLGRRH